MYENILKLIDDAIAEKQILLDYYRDTNDELKEQIEKLENELAMLKGEQGNENSK